MTARYAIYYVPAAQDALTRRASAWLGRDPFTGWPAPRPDIPGLAGLDLDALTEEPRGYGFHATLKAPFELAAGAEEAGLLAFASAFAERRSPFEAEIRPARVSRFLAFQLDRPSPEMQDLHEACVREFDRFRAPLGDFDLARRRKAGLSPEQDARLITWGYPHVFEGFRFHMTLTGSIQERDAAARLLQALEDYFIEVSGPHRFDGMAVFKQDERGAPFHVLRRLAFQGGQALKAAG